MKTVSAWVVVAVSVVVIAAFFCTCAPVTGGKDAYKATFNLNYQSGATAQTVEVKANEKVTNPPTPSAKDTRSTVGISNTSA